MNLGPRSRAWLAQVGITDGPALAAADAVGLYLRIRALQPGASLNLLWGLVGAQLGQPWQQVARERRTDLLLELDQRQRRAPGC